MRTTHRVILVLSAVLFCANGCNKTQQEKVGNASYWELPNDAVVLDVNGHKLTKGDQERILDLQEALTKIGNKSVSVRQLKAMRTKMLQSCESVFIHKTLVEEWGRTNGIVLANHEVEKARIDFALRLSRGQASYDQICSRLPKGLAGELDRFIDDKCYTVKCTDELAKRNKKPVSSQEVAKRRSYFKEYNKVVAATNAIAWAAASNLWKRVQKNPAAFNDEIVKYQQNEVEHISSDPDMGEVGLSFFEDGDPTWKADLMRAHEGDVLRPRIGDNGLLMVRVLACIPPDENHEPKEPKWRLSKIFWELGEEWVPQSNAELLDDLEKIHMREAREQGYRALLEGVKVTYPSGTNLLHRAKAKDSRHQQRRSKLPPGAMVPDKVRKAIEKGE